MKFNSEAYKLIFNFCDASPLMMIQSTIFFKMYFKLRLLVFGVKAKFVVMLSDAPFVANACDCALVVGSAKLLESMEMFECLYQCRKHTSI